MLKTRLGTGGGDGATVLPLHVEASDKRVCALAKHVLDRHDAMLAWHHLRRSGISAVSLALINLQKMGCRRKVGDTVEVIGGSAPWQRD